MNRLHQKGCSRLQNPKHFSTRTVIYFVIYIRASLCARNRRRVERERIRALSLSLSPFVGRLALARVECGFLTLKKFRKGNSRHKSRPPLSPAHSDEDYTGDFGFCSRARADFPICSYSRGPPALSAAGSAS